MNNELIERIDAEIEKAGKIINDLESIFGRKEENCSDWEIIRTTFQDCKAALTQQQEAEPVAWMAINKERPERVHFSSHQTHMENLAAYPGSTEFWDDTPLYRHPSKRMEPPIGKWLSAMLDDPGVCEEMKADIRAWFDAGEPYPAAQPQVPESRNIRSVEIQGDQSVIVSFPSCRIASAFASWLSAAKEES